MDQKMVWLWCSWIAIAYLVGAIPFGFLIGKSRGIDVRTVGSKNIGATNVYRTVGKKWGFLAFFCDFLKGYAPTIFCLSTDFGYANPDLPVAVGLACVIGHTLTCFMKFKGGKGVATAFGMLMALCPALVSLAFALFVVTVWLSHYISLGSCLAAAFMAIAIWFNWPSATVYSLKIVMTILGAFIVIKHKSNIVRLIHGNENKIY